MDSGCISHNHIRVFSVAHCCKLLIYRMRVTSISLTKVCETFPKGKKKPGAMRRAFTYTTAYGIKRSEL